MNNKNTPIPWEIPRILETLCQEVGKKIITQHLPSNFVNNIKLIESG